jgi:hypothetical protein
MSEVNAVSGAGGATPATSTKTAASKSTKDFKETLKTVDGHKYAQITNGPRKGEYVNQSGNDRDGDAFKLVKRDGFEFHVYGDRVVRLPKSAS